METHFALDDLPVHVPDGEGFVLHIDSNSKSTHKNGTHDQPSPNSLSFVQIKDCPGATETCKKVCYVHKLEKEEQLVHDKYAENSETMRRILTNPVYADCAAGALANYIFWAARHGFRWHNSGDLFSVEHARFVAETSRRAAPVLCWLYTRSFCYLPVLLGVSNLKVLLSGDKDNFPEALALYQQYDLQLTYLVVDAEDKNIDLLPDGSVIFPSHALRGREGDFWRRLNHKQRQMVCPVDLVGQSENNRCGNHCFKCFLEYKPARS